MPNPLAYFLTWTCHGAWLPGDERGWVDSAHNAYGTPVLPPDPDRKAESEEAMSGRSVTLDRAAREVVVRAIEDHCRVRGWKILALAVRTNHVHVVLVAPGYRPEIVMGQLKSWATRRLRDVGMRDGSRVWTREGSTRHLFFQEAVNAAIAYVRDGQGVALD